MADILIKTKSGNFKTVGVDGVKAPPVLDNFASAKKEEKIETLVDIENLFQGNKKVVPSPTPKKPEIKNVVPPSPAPAPKSVAPAFYFDVKDEEEAKNFKDNELVGDRQKKEQLINLGAAKIARQIKENAPEAGVNSPEDLSRLSKIVASRLREIRSLIDTKESLMKIRENGGLSIAPEAAGKIMKVLEKEKTLWQKDPEKYCQGQSATVSVERVSSSQPRSPFVKPVASPAEKPRWREEFDNGPSDVDNPQLQKIITAMKAGNRQPENKAISMEEKDEDNRPGYNYDSYLLKEKRERRVMGPVEELLNMDLKEFRALGRSPKEAVNKIYEKIINLAHDSLEEKSKGVAAWKSSPLYQDYLAVGEESLIKGLPVEGILKNSHGLTWDEFQAIGDLNEQLNY